MKQALNHEKVELIISKSHFIAENFILSDVSQVKTIIKEQKERHPGAAHVCHAFFFGRQREVAGSSDDREPSGTAGRPMMEVLKGSQLTNILVTVVRYFGGVKLGTGGLVRAYSDSVKELLTQLETEEIEDKVLMSFYVGYGDYEKVRHFIEKKRATICSEEFAEEVYAQVELPLTESETFRQNLIELTAARIRILDS